MNLIRLTALSLCSCFLFAACDGDSGGPEGEFRAQELAVGDFGVHEGADASNSDCLIFDILGSDVYDAQAPSDDPRVVLSIEEDRLVGPDGQTRCTIETQGNRAYLHVGDADGPVAFTAWKNHKWVLDGDFNGPPIGGGLPSAVVYTMLGDHVHVGMPSGEIVATATTVNLQKAQAETKLLVAALLEGTCF